MNGSIIGSSWPEVEPERFEDEDRFFGRYNVAPRTYSPILRRVGSPDWDDESNDSPSSSSHLILQSMRWGVVPHYSKHEDKSLSTINAKGEHLTDGTSSLWNGLKGRKRCVVPVQGYYEWLKKSEKDKIPHFTRYKDQKIMMLAGMWDVVTLEGSEEPLYTFTIVTTASSQQLSFLHDRMPVVLPSVRAIQLWLSDADWSPELAKLVKPCDEVIFDCYPVPTEVGKVGAEDPSFVEPVSERKDGIEAMFKRQTQTKQASAEGKPKKKKEKETSPSSTLVIISDSSESSELSQSQSQSQTKSRSNSSPSKKTLKRKQLHPSSPGPSAAPKTSYSSQGSPKKSKIADEDEPETEANKNKITRFFAPTSSQSQARSTRSKGKT